MLDVSYPMAFWVFMDKTLPLPPPSISFSGSLMHTPASHPKLRRKGIIKMKEKVVEGYWDIEMLDGDETLSARDR